MYDTQAVQAENALVARDATVLETQINALRSAVARHEEVLERANKQLSRLAQPRSTAELLAEKELSGVSPISADIRDLAKRVEAFSDNLIELLDTLDV